jgi:hypothetical protein
MLIISFGLKWTVHKEFILTGQTVNSVYYCDVYGDCVKTVPQNLVTNELAVASQQCTISHFLFQQGIFTRINKTVVLHPPYFSVSPIECRHFDTSGMTDIESQAVLITLTKQGIQYAFDKWEKCWEWCIHAEGDYFKGDGGRYAQVSF